MQKNFIVFFWSPMLSHIGTISAVNSMALSLSRYSKFKCFIINVLGEFNEFENEENNLSFLKIFDVTNYVPKTGLVSKIFLHLFALLSLPKLVYFIIKYRPRIIITSLIGYLPSILKIFFKKTIFINSIQGLPKFNYVRKLLWKFSYKNSDFIFTMTDLTKRKIIEDIGINNKKIFKVENPVISRSIRKSSLIPLKPEYQDIFSRKVYCSIGRLTKQKNYLNLIKYLNEYQKKNKDFFNLIIIGEGEEQKKLQNYIYSNNIKNFFLLGFQKNPYNFLYNSDLYISTSLWEEPGHTLLEAGYLNIPVFTSDCENGPKEIMQNGINCLRFKNNNKEDFINQLKKFKDKESFDINLKYNLKKTTKAYTQFTFAKKFNNIIDDSILVKNN